MPWIRSRIRRQEELESLLIRQHHLLLESLLMMVEQIVGPMLAQQAETQRKQVWSLAAELAGAMQRQDNLLKHEIAIVSLNAGNHHDQTMELLMELLQTLQPTAQEQLLGAGLLTPPPSPRTSAT